MQKDNKTYDIKKVVSVTKEELKNGTSKEITLKTGEVLDIDIPRNTSPGEVITLKGLGKKKENGRRGNLNIVIAEVKEKEGIKVNVRVKEKEIKEEKHVCQNCGNELNENDIFCNKCGTKVEIIKKKIIKTNKCLSCGNKLGENDLFCQKCGSRRGEDKAECKGENFFNPNVLNYDCVVFINSQEAEMGCYKKVKIRPYKSIMIPIKKGVENEEIIHVNINESIIRTLVIVSDFPKSTLDMINGRLSDVEVSLTKNEQIQLFALKAISRNQKVYNYKVPRYNTRKAIVYVRGDENVPGFKCVVTKEDFSYYLTILFGIILCFVYIWFMVERVDQINDTASFFKVLGEGIGYYLIFYLLQYAVGNKRWK